MEGPPVHEAASLPMHPQLSALSTPRCLLLLHANLVPSVLFLCPKCSAHPFFFLTPLAPGYFVISPQSFLREPFPDLSAKARSPSLLITGDTPLKHTSELPFYTCVLVWSRFISLTRLSSIRTGIIPGFAHRVSRAQPKAWHMAHAQWKLVGEWNEDNRICSIFCFMKVYPQSPWFTVFTDIYSFFNKLKSSWFTMLCSFLRYSKVIQLYICIHFVIFFSVMVSHRMYHSSLCCTVRPCCLSILYITVCIF